MICKPIWSKPWPVDLSSQQPKRRSGVGRRFSLFGHQTIFSNGQLETDLFHIFCFVVHLNHSIIWRCQMKTVKIIFAALLCIAIFIIVYWAINPTKSPSWTGFGPYDEDLNGSRSKTLWDWLDLLIVPIFLAVGAWLLSAADKESELNLELDRQNQGVLTSFMDNLSKLLLESNLRESKPATEVRWIARTYALAAFRVLDDKRKAEALQFLFETGLISENPIISLNSANLRSVILDRAALVKAEIKGAYFQNASFKGANLSDTNFCGSDFSNADFRGSILDGTNLSFAILKNVNLSGLDLTQADLNCADLSGANIKNTKITKEQLKQLASMPQ
jgi:uncharacterized protein YjbI with pentapeptide repeats